MHCLDEGGLSPGEYYPGFCSCLSADAGYSLLQSRMETGRTTKGQVTSCTAETRRTRSPAMGYKNIEIRTDLVRDWVVQHRDRS